MDFFVLGPIFAIAVLAMISLVLFLCGEYLVNSRMVRGPIFGIFWAIVTIIPVFAGIPLLMLRPA